MDILGSLKDWEAKRFCRIYPTMMGLGTIIPYPKKIQNIYEPRDTSVEF